MPSLISALHPMNPLHKLVSLITPSNPGLCALCGLAQKNIPHAHTPTPTPTPTPFTQQHSSEETFHRYSSSTPHSSPATLQISPCNHVFHEPCLLSWLEEGLRDYVSECGRVERVSRGMRTEVVAAGCAECREVEILVKRSGVGIYVLEELVQGVVGKGGESGGSSMLSTMTTTTTAEEERVGDVLVLDQRPLGEQWLASRILKKMREEELAREMQLLEIQEARSTPSRRPLLAYMKIGKCRRKKRGTKGSVEVDDEFFDKPEAMGKGARKDWEEGTCLRVGE